MRAVLCALLVACASAPAHLEPVSTQPSGLAEMELRTLSGEPLRLADLRGRVVLLDVWATWCDPCRDSLPFYAQLQRELEQRGFSVVAVSVDEEEESVREFQRVESLPFVIVLDPKAEVPEALGVDTMPECYLIDRGGNIRFRHRGFMGADERFLRREIERLLEES